MEQIPKIVDDWNPDAITRYWSDQPWINDNTEQNYFGKECGVYSYKAHCKPVVPVDAKFIFFHGKPRPWRLGWEV